MMCSTGRVTASRSTNVLPNFGPRLADGFRFRIPLSIIFSMRALRAELPELAAKFDERTRWVTQRG